MHHRIVIIGGGTAGLSVAARLRRLGMADVALVEPAGTHYYQPLFTLVGAGVVPLSRSVRNEADLVPPGVAWIRDAVAAVEPAERLVQTESGARIHYDVLVCCPGVELAWDLVPGLAEAMASPHASSNYAPGLADKTRRLLERFEGGQALFCAPATPIKCPGAPQKAAYLASDSWRRRGILSKSTVRYVTGAGGIFGVEEFARVLEGVIERYGIATHFSTELVEVDPDSRKATVEHRGPQGSERQVLAYDLLHVAPPQRAPRFVREGPLSDGSPLGWVPVDRHHLRHVRHPEVFALGDVCDAPTSKTGAAIRRQAPVVAENVRALLVGEEPTAHYDGYAACPITTAYGRLLLAEFDYSLRPHPTLPFLDTTRERADLWWLKRSLLPAFYWHAMIRGRG
ncbi:MAG: FAD/NAD(P)-binding oxidoreductase [Actinomycetota bacterium]|nr:FAD/NAD(P)-binding oxidoreductase [Actinomycetota bacterium]